MRCPLSNQFYNFFLLAYPLEWNFHFQMRDILKSRLLSLLKLVSYQDWVGFSYMYLAPWVVLMQCGFFFSPKYFPERSFWMMQTKKIFFLSLFAVRKGYLQLDTAVRTGIYTTLRTETWPYGIVLSKAPVMRRACEVQESKHRKH